MLLGVVSKGFSKGSSGALIVHFPDHQNWSYLTSGHENYFPLFPTAEKYYLPLNEGLYLVIWRRMLFSSRQSYSYQQNEHHQFLLSHPPNSLSHLTLHNDINAAHLQKDLE